jgi:ferric-dicitrate binding protein FerR (iron transport regulator)
VCDHFGRKPTGLGVLVLAADDEHRRSESGSMSGMTNEQFAQRWNALNKVHRRQIRRLARIGRAQENSADAQLAVVFAAFQQSRSWYRRFWLWFPVLVVAGVIAGLAIHPLIVGIVVGFAANALFVRRNYSRVAIVNAELLA